MGSLLTTCLCVYFHKIGQFQSTVQSSGYKHRCDYISYIFTVDFSSTRNYGRSCALISRLSCAQLSIQESGALLRTLKNCLYIVIFVLDKLTNRRKMHFIYIDLITGFKKLGKCSQGLTLKKLPMLLNFSSREAIASKCSNSLKHILLLPVVIIPFALPMSE